MSTRPAPPPPDTPDTGDPLGVSPPDAEEGQRALMHMPVDVRSVSLAVLAVLACVAALRLAGAVFIPLMLGVMFSYALGPVIDTLERWRIPRSIGTAVLMTAIVAPWVATPIFTEARSPPPLANTRSSTRPAAAPTPKRAMSTPNCTSLALSTSRT